MLYWALMFLIVALIAGAMGFGLIGGLAYTAARILFFVFLVLFIVSLVTGTVSPTRRVGATQWLTPGRLRQHGRPRSGRGGRERAGGMKIQRSQDRRERRQTGSRWGVATTRQLPRHHP